MSGKAIATTDPASTTPIKDALAVRAEEMRRVRTFLVERKHVYQKFRRNPTTGVQEAREKVDHAGLMEAWKLFGGKELRTDDPVIVMCVENGCPDALPVDTGFSVRAYAVNVEGAKFTVSGHSCKHNAPSVRLALREVAETKAIDRVVSMALATGLGNLAELPATEYDDWTAKWAVAPEVCRRFFDGQGSAVNEHGHKWVKGGPRGYELHHRIDDGAMPHPPELQKQLDRLKLEAKEPPPEICAWIKEGRGMNDAEFVAAIVKESERLEIPDEQFVEMVHSFDPGSKSLSDLSLENKAALFRQLSDIREAKYKKAKR